MFLCKVSYQHCHGQQGSDNPHQFSYSQNVPENSPLLVLTSSNSTIDNLKLTLLSVQNHNGDPC